MHGSARKSHFRLIINQAMNIYKLNVKIYSISELTQFKDENFSIKAINRKRRRMGDKKKPSSMR